MCGLYIHIPFCVQKCKYCDFNSFSGLEGLFDDYFSCLDKEIERTKKNGDIFDTIYIGGGTPTAVDNFYLTGLIKSITNRTENCEITVECNPGTAGFDDLINLRRTGANRLSIGLQSTDNDELKMLGRIHTAEDFDECFQNARRAGFDNISIDVMFGLPGQTVSKLEKTLYKASSYKSEHISAYCLKVEEGTPFSKMKLNLPDDDTCAEMYELCVSFLKKCGYNRYEISNFARDGKISRHNTKYWTIDDYMGIGAGAHSLYKGKRFSKISNVKKYIETIDRGGSAVENEETLTEFDKMSQFVFLGLRLEEGISLDRFNKIFGRSINSVFGEQINKYTKMNVMEIKDRRLFIKPEFLYVSNNILSDFV